MLLISDPNYYSGYELPEIDEENRERSSDKPELIRILKRQCCLQVFLSVIATLAVVISLLLLFAEGKDTSEQ